MRTDSWRGRVRNSRGHDGPGKNTKRQKEHECDWSISVSRERGAKRAWEQSTIPVTVRILVNQRQAHYNALLSITRVWEPLPGHVHTVR